MSLTFTTPGRWRRFACMMYESILLFGIIFLAGYLLDTLTQTRDALALRPLRQSVVFIALGIYFVLCWTRKGQTLAMKTWHIRVIDQQGNKPALSKSLIRYLLAWPIPLLSLALVFGLSKWTGYASTDLLVVFVPFTPFIWTWFDRDQQFLHDRLLGTRLISVTPAARANKA